jgi:hypothetical protein
VSPMPLLVSTLLFEFAPIVRLCIARHSPRQS